MFGGLSKCPPGIPRAGRARCARGVVRGQRKTGWGAGTPGMNGGVRRAEIVHAGRPRAGRARCAKKGWGVSERAAEVWRCNIMFVIGATAPITPHYVPISHGDKARLLKLKMRGRGRESVGLFRKEAGRSRAAVVHMSMERPAAVWRCILARHRATGRGAWIRKGSRSRVRRLLYLDSMGRGRESVGSRFAGQKRAGGRGTAGGRAHMVGGSWRVGDALKHHGWPVEGPPTTTDPPTMCARPINQPVQASLPGWVSSHTVKAIDDSLLTTL